MLLLLLTVGGGAASLVLGWFLLQAFVQSKSSHGAVQEFLLRASAGPVAHRAGKPENTLAGFRLCKAQGASGVEVDLMFSQDGHPVLIHDETVDRTSNSTGRVCELTLEQLKSLDVGFKAGSEFAGERIPTLREALDVCKELNLLMFLELKEDAEKSAALIKKLFSRDPSLYNMVAIISFHPSIIHKLRRMDPELLLGLVYRSGYGAYWLTGERRHASLIKHLLYVLYDALVEWSLKSWLWWMLGISLLIVHKNDILGKIFVAGLWERRKVCVVAWTVNDREEKTHFESELKIPYFTDHVL